MGLSPGDVVMLVSGGERMTFEKVIDADAGRVQCVWFDGTGALRRQEFRIYNLVQYVPQAVEGGEA